MYFSTCRIIAYSEKKHIFIYYFYWHDFSDVHISEVYSLLK